MRTMKIGIITFHNTSNFGATLQCAALYRYLISIGHEVVIINYLPDFVIDKKSIFKELKKVRINRNMVKALVKGFIYASHRNELEERDHRFESFINKHISLSIPYYSINEIFANPPSADFFICGSDQIWNPVLTGGKLDKAFFLQFTKSKKASYGASTGELDIELYERELKELTRDYIGISVRESSIASRLSRTINRNVEVVLDCTFLLGQKEYKEMEESTGGIDTPYLLLYNIQKSEKSAEIAKKIAKNKKISIIDISPNPLIRSGGEKKIVNIGPGEFLTLFKNAEYVVTNSFHGTVFSIIYEKPFYSIPHSTRGGRTIDLLKLLGLENRLILNGDIVTFQEINYTDVNKNLMLYKKRSYDYLKKILR